MPERRTGWSHLPAVAIALAGAGTLIYWWRLAKPLWVDEEMLALNTRWRSFPELAGALWLDQSAPLGWLALERTSLLLFGFDERAARALTVLFGIGTLAVAVWIGRRWMGPLGAAALAAVCAIGPWIVFFTLELKHYSADVCWALLLPALAAWSVERECDVRTRPTIVFWSAAAVGLWFSNGATFVTPGCAVVVVAECWRRDGFRAAARAAAPAAIWLASLGLNYLLVLQHALGNAYLQNYWSFAFPPARGGIVGTAGWVGHVVQTFPVKPVGTDWPMLFWSAVLVGFAYACLRSRALGAAFALVPTAGLALGLLGIVPPFERLGLWIVPALYVGLACAVDAGARWWREGGRGFQPARLAAAALVLAISGYVTWDIVSNGARELEAKPTDSNYGLDDRRAIRRVQELRQAGDVILTTHFGLAGLWWYGGVDISNVDRSGRLEDSRLFEISYARDRETCEEAANRLEALTNEAHRAIVSLGFRMNVLPEGFDRFVLDELSRRGALVAYGRYGDLSHVAVFDFGRPPNPGERSWLADAVSTESQPLDGCLVVRPAHRW